ncbi:aldo/keto reductase [Candidatus Poribacteria bacterium]
MKKRKCGNSSLELPLLGIGCWSFGGGSYWGEQDQRDVDVVVHRALDIGCDFFDTAEAYNDGASEESLGKALKGRRSQATIGSKISPSNTAPEVLREHCEASLRRLQTDYIDLYMIHWPIHPHSIRHFTDDETVINNPPSTATAFETLIKLREEGKIRYIGVSNFGVQQLTEALDIGAEIVSNELPYSLLTRAIDKGILPLCQERSIGILAYMPLMQGLLAGKYETSDDVPSIRARTRHFSGSRPHARHKEPGAEGLTFAAISRIKAIAGEQDISMAHLALAWCMANPGITCVLVGARNVSQLESNAQAASLSLHVELIEELNVVTIPLLERLGSSPDYYENTAMSRAW